MLLATEPLLCPKAISSQKPKGPHLVAPADAMTVRHPGMRASHRPVFVLLLPLLHFPINELARDLIPSCLAPTRIQSWKCTRGSLQDPLRGELGGQGWRLEALVSGKDLKNCCHKQQRRRRPRLLVRASSGQL